MEPVGGPGGWFPLSSHPAPDTLNRADDWMDLADCVQMPTDIFYPLKGQSTTDAKQICRGCEVRTQCLTAAMRIEGDERHGVFGGLSPKERDALRESGWQLGDPAPSIKGGIGDCPECGKSCRDVRRHVNAKHPQSAA